MADYPRITGTIRPTPRNRVSGFLADLLEMGAKGYDVGSTLQAGGPITEGRLSTPVSDLLGIPELQRTLNRVSYNEPLTTGTGYTTKLRPDTLSAAMTVAPGVGPTAKAGAAGAKMAGTALKDLATSDVAYDAAMNAMRRSGGLAELTAYHGTPHKFAATERNPLGEFRASQIGTGEGAQAYGHGLYVAENPKVAKEYQFQADIDPDKVLYKNRPINYWYNQAQKEQDIGHRLRNQEMIDQANAKTAYWESVMTRRHPEEVLRQMEDPNYGWQKATDYAKSVDLKKFKNLPNSSSFYHVDLPDPMIDKMLHWNKPLSEQPEILKSLTPEAMGLKLRVAPQSGFMGYVTESGKPIGVQSKGSTPENFRKLWLERIAEYGDAEGGAGRLIGYLGGISDPTTASQVSEALRKAGIPGIQYFDAASRDAGKGTRNFVVFPGEEQNLTILKRE
jgi:hypothetical protein